MAKLGQWSRDQYVDQKPKSNLLDFVVIIRKPEKTGLKEGWEAAKPEEVTWEFAKKLNSVQYKLEAHGYYAVIESSEESSYLDLRQLGSNYLEFLSVAKKIHHKTYISESDAKKLAPGKEVRYVGEPVYLLSWSHELVDSSQTSLWSSSEGFKSLKPIFDLQDRKNTKLDPMVRE